jgi:hypothetical protein
LNRPVLIRSNRTHGLDKALIEAGQLVQSSPNPLRGWTVGLDLGLWVSAKGLTVMTRVLTIMSYVRTP